MKMSTLNSQHCPHEEAHPKLHDETRQRLIEAAGEVFAEAGYQAATVRDICARAGANVAAVNYHFGDKLGLYTELLKSAAQQDEEPVMESALRAPDAAKALRRFLHGMVRLMNKADRPSVYVRLMMHELAQPTPALATVVEHVIKPKAQILHAIVGQLIGRPPDDPQTRMCAYSIIGQVVHYGHARPVIELQWPGFSMTPEMIEEIANHITEFSLNALKGLKRKSTRKATSTRRAK